MIKRFFQLGLTAVAVCLLTASCMSSKTDNTLNNLAQRKDKVYHMSKAVLASVRASVAAYEVSQPLPPATKVKLVEAGTVAAAAIEAIPTADTTSLPGLLRSAMTSIQGMMAAMPPESIKPGVTAAVAAFEVFVETMLASVDVPVTDHGAESGPVVPVNQK